MTDADPHSSSASVDETRPSPTAPVWRFTERLRVRWSEIDAQHIVFNGHYLMYFDTAMAGYWRALALPYHETMAALHGDLYVRKATVEYRGSARYDEVLDIGLRCERIGRTSVAFSAAVLRQGVRLVDGELIYVFADPATQRPLPVPETLRQVLEGFEKGEAPLEVMTSDWAAAEAGARAMRETVFAREQGIDAQRLVDAADAEAVHALARNRLGAVVGSGRLLPADDRGVSTIGRMAVHGALRGAGVGRALLDALAGRAAARGDRRLRLHAQASAVGFYRRLGFVACGEPFVEVGLPHQTMERPVAAAGAG